MHCTVNKGLVEHGTEFYNQTSELEGSPSKKLSFQHRPVKYERSQSDFIQLATYEETPNINHTVWFWEWACDSLCEKGELNGDHSMAIKSLYLSCLFLTKHLCFQ